MFHIQDQNHGVFLKKHTRRHFFAKNLLHGIGVSVDFFVLGPEIGVVVTSTGTKWNQMINFEVLATEIENFEAQVILVNFNHLVLFGFGNISFTVGDFFRIAILIRIRTECSRSFLVIGLQWKRVFREYAVARDDNKQTYTPVQKSAVFQMSPK